MNGRNFIVNMFIKTEMNIGRKFRIHPYLLRMEK